MRLALSQEASLESRHVITDGGSLPMITVLHRGIEAASVVN